jgi:hypothetical protein
VTTKATRVLLYSTSLETWEVWQMGRPIAHGTLENCQRAYPDLTPGYSQLLLAGLVVDAEIDACSECSPDDVHDPHLRRARRWPQSPPPDPAYLWCFGYYDQDRQNLRVKVRWDTETLVAVGGSAVGSAVEGSREHNHPFTILEEGTSA